MEEAPITDLGLPYDPDVLARMTSDVKQWQELTRGLPKRIVIFQCPECKSYFQPPEPDDPPHRQHWIAARPQSLDLLLYLVRRLKTCLKPFKPNLDLSLPHFTPNSGSVLAITITLVKDFPSGIHEKYVYSVEYDVHHRMCEVCCPICEQSCSVKGTSEMPEQLCFGKGTDDLD